MKISGWLAVTVVATMLTLQGYAQTDTVRSGTSAATNPAPTVVPVAKASAQGVAAIPQNASGKPVVVADTKDNFEAVAAAIKQQMQPGGRFSFVSSAGRETVNTHLGDMASLFEKYGAVDKMTPMATSRLMEDQNAVNEVLARYDSNRVICRQETPTGTHFSRKVCRTLGEIQRQQQNASKYLNDTLHLQGNGH